MLLQGDSGGPTQCPDGQGGWIQVGIASWVSNIPRCDTDYPSVYTNVATFRDWVSDNCGGCI